MPRKRTDTPPPEGEEWRRVGRQLSFALYSASNRIIRLHRPLLEPLGLTYPQFLVLVATHSSSQRGFSFLSGPEALSALSQTCHNWNRHVASISANVGVSLSLYHGRCRWACVPYCPDAAYQQTNKVPTNHAIGAA